MSQLHVQHAVLVGNSLGGYVAWKTAVDYPSRITKLILIDAAGYKYESQSVPSASGWLASHSPVQSSPIYCQRASSPTAYAMCTVTRQK
jgi:pimeloyl-ACP methyl ester carboxylesterase